MVYFLKSSGAALKPENIAAEVTYGELGAEPLEQLESMIQNVYMPMLSNAGNQEGWGDVAGKEIVEKLHNFLANVSITYGQARAWLRPGLSLARSFVRGGLLLSPFAPHRGSALPLGSPRPRSA